MKKLTALVVLVVMMLSMTTVFADFNALYTTSKVVVNGEEVAFEAYNINDNNYFKLRDVAKALSGTKKQFEVTWNQEENAIELLSGKNYTVVGGELAQGDGTAKRAKLTTSQIKLDGEWVNADTLTAYNINDNNYFKLRDLGKMFDFGISWDGEANCITVNTEESYVEEGAKAVKEFSLGTIEGNVYKNEFLGIGCEIPEGWHFYNAEEMKLQNGLPTDMTDEEYFEAIKNSEVPFIVVATDEMKTSNFNIVIEKVDNAVLAEYTEREIMETQIQGLIDELRSMGATDFKYGFSTTDNVDVLELYSVYGGMSVYQILFAVKCDGYLASVAISSLDGNSAQQMFNSFFWLD